MACYNEECDHQCRGIGNWCRLFENWENKALIRHCLSYKTKECAVKKLNNDLKKKAEPKMNIHCLKTWPNEFKDVRDGSKTFEIRQDDRGFKTGDLLILQEWEPQSEKYTKEMIAVKVVYFIKGRFKLPKDVCVMGIERI